MRLSLFKGLNCLLAPLRLLIEFPDQLPIKIGIIILPATHHIFMLFLPGFKVFKVSHNAIKSLSESLLFLLRYLLIGLNILLLFLCLFLPKSPDVLLNRRIVFTALGLNLTDVIGVIDRLCLKPPLNPINITLQIHTLLFLLLFQPPNNILSLLSMLFQCLFSFFLPQFLLFLPLLVPFLLAFLVLFYPDHRHLVVVLNLALVILDHLLFLLH